MDYWFTFNMRIIGLIVTGSFVFCVFVQIQQTWFDFHINKEISFLVTHVACWTLDSNDLSNINGLYRGFDMTSYFKFKIWPWATSKS